MNSNWEREGRSQGFPLFTGPSPGGQRVERGPVPTLDSQGVMLFHRRRSNPLMKLTNPIVWRRPLMRLLEVYPGVCGDCEGGSIVYRPKLPSDNPRTWNPANLSTGLLGQGVPSVLTPLSSLPLCPRMLGRQDPFFLQLLLQPLPLPMLKSLHLTPSPHMLTPSMATQASCPGWIITQPPDTWAWFFWEWLGAAAQGEKGSEPRSLSHGPWQVRRGQEILNCWWQILMPNSPIMQIQIRKLRPNVTCSRSLIYLLPKSKLESSSHRYHTIDMAASAMPRRNRRKTMIFPEIPILIGDWEKYWKALHWNYWNRYYETNKEKSKLIFLKKACVVHIK